MKLTITSVEISSFATDPEYEEIKNLHGNLGEVKSFRITSSDDMGRSLHKTLCELEGSKFSYCIKKSKGGKEKTGKFPFPGDLKIEFFNNIRNRGISW